MRVTPFEMPSWRGTPNDSLYTAHSDTSNGFIRLTLLQNNYKNQTGFGMKYERALFKGPVIICNEMVQIEMALIFKIIKIKSLHPRDILNEVHGGIIW